MKELLIGGGDPINFRNEMKEERKLSIKILDKDKVFIKKEL